MQNKGSVPKMLKGWQGENTFCRNCERNNICQDKAILPKILRCCSDAIEFYSANRNYKNYVWPGSYRDQPKWLMEMSDIVGIEKAKVDEEIRKREHGNR